MYNCAVGGVQFPPTALFNQTRRGCSTSNGQGVQLERYIHKRRTSHSLFGGDFYAHNGRYSKNQVRLWRCARDRMERLPDMREMVAIIKMDEQIFELESNIKKEKKK